MNKGHQRITLRDVAREAGVSPATVGFVLSNDPHQTISPATREKVQQAAQARGMGPQAYCDELAATWKEESLVMSSVTAMARLPSYQQIIALGPGVVPLLLREPTENCCLDQTTSSVMCALAHRLIVERYPPSHTRQTSNSLQERIP